MKKKLLIIVLQLVVSSMLLGQSAKKSKIDDDPENKFRLGVSAGVNLNKLSGKTFNDGLNYNYQLGGFAQINFSRRIGIQPELHFAQLSSEFTNDGTDVYDDLFLDGQQVKAKLSYIKTQVLMNINVGASKRVKLQLGPQVGFLASEKVKNLVNSNQELFKKTSWAAIGGLWIQLPFIHLGGRFEQGITNINKIDGRPDWNRQTFTIFAGVTF
jgi:Outer membrane protein beta-barrel domain